MGNMDYYLAYPEQISIGDRAYFEGDLPGRLQDFLTVTKIDQQRGGFFFHVAEHPDGDYEPYAVNETELIPVLVEADQQPINTEAVNMQHPINIAEAAQKKAARNSIAGLVANAPEVIETYKNLLAALAGLDDPQRAVDLLDMVIATGLPGAERRISTITSVCPNGHTETADIPVNAGPQDIIEALAELRGVCPECEKPDPFLERLHEVAETNEGKGKRWSELKAELEALNPSGLDPLTEDER